MIERYRDHAANERTYLAWIRTGITVIVLGFIIKKFEIFITSITSALSSNQYHIVTGPAAEYVSLALILLGILMNVFATVRYFSVKAALESNNALKFHGSAHAIILTGMLALFGGYLLFYMHYTFLG